MFLLLAMAPVHNNISTPRTQLLRILGAGFGLAAVVGGTVGVGILHLPGTVAAELGNFWLILAVWVIGGLYALFGAISVAELAAMLPQAGGFYVYAKRAFGDLTGFSVGWGDWLNNCSTLAFASYAAAEYLKALAPAFPGSPKIIALTLLVFFAALHWTGLRVGSLAQELTSSATAITLLVLAVACFLYRAPAHAVSSENINVVPAIFRSNLGVRACSRHS
jgi:APA family basic amino acid/polyamine antiporter